MENPDAVSLPLGLAIALLQDADGKIKLDVPITGNLDNPEFSVAGIVVDALVNVITKIVSSPFAAIGDLIEGDEDISKINFAAGKAELDAQQKQKLDRLIGALKKRPVLTLEIKGTAFSDKDWPQMQAAALNRQIAQLHYQEEIKKGNEKAMLQPLATNDEDYQRLLADQFIVQFPELGERSLFGTPRLKQAEQGDFYLLAAEKLAAKIPVDRQSLKKLAIARAQTIAKYLADQEIERSRLYLVDVDLAPETTDEAISSQLNLEVQ